MELTFATILRLLIQTIPAIPTCYAGHSYAFQFPFEYHELCPQRDAANNANAASSVPRPLERHNLAGRAAREPSRDALADDFRD